jgi:hypothetical protein
VVVKLVDGRTLEGRMEVVDQAGLHLREHPSKVKGRPPKLDEEATVAVRRDQVHTSNHQVQLIVP